MRVPLSWLRDYVDFDLEPEALAEKLTLLGMEVKSVTRIGADWQNVVVGELLEVGPHPNSTKLQLTRVRVGPSHPILSIVCGAHNFAPGDLVVVVLPGGVLPGNFEISARKTYGHVSAGMICSARELGIGEDHDGIIVLPAEAGEPGEDARPVLGLDEEVIEFEINPDRAYALSVRGVAREAALGSPRRTTTRATAPSPLPMRTATRCASRTRRGVRSSWPAP